MVNNKKSSQNILPGDVGDVSEKIKSQESGQLPEVTKKESNLAEQKEALEKRERNPDEVINKKIRQELEKIDLDDSLKIQSQNQAHTIKNLKEQEKLKNLLKIAKDKGVVFAVDVAKKMNDPYLLDSFHDLLAKEGYYKNFLQ